MIYKIVAETEWRAAAQVGRFEGSPVDRRDGFIHFSTALQVRDTAGRHFANQAGLLLIGVDDTALAIRWEPSRGGDLFPHLYEPLPMSAVRSVQPLPLDGNGEHLFPDAVPA